jgi:L-iditol 2-dehydrogenase
VCALCRGGRINLCLERRSIGSAVNGGFTSYVIVPERNIHVLPDNVSFLSGALTEPLACVVHAVLETSHLVTGDVAVIAGPGAIGLLTAQVAKACGALTILLGTEGDEHRLEVAERLGVDHVQVVERNIYRDLVAELTHGAGADVVYECSGAQPAAQVLLDVVKRRGRYTQIGLFGKSVVWDLDQVCYKELAVAGSFATVPSSFDRALRLLAEGSVVIEPLVSGVFPVTQWQEAFDVFQNRSGLKTVLRPDEGAIA